MRNAMLGCMKKALLAAIALLLAASLSGCAGGSPDDLSGADVQVRDYRGSSINCVKQGLLETNTRACDFARFYAAHPDLLKKNTEGSEEGVEWVDYNGQPLACLKDGTQKSKTRSCDFDRFYAAHPDLLKD